MFLAPPVVWHINTLMNLVLALVTLGALWGATYAIGLVLHRLAARLDAVSVPDSVLHLAALGVLSLAAFAACALGFAPVPAPTYLEALAPQPTLAGWFLGLGGLGLGLWLRRDIGPVVRRGNLMALLRRHADAPTVCLAVLWLGLFAWTLLPPFLTDEALYHLTLPVQYLRHGGLAVIAGHGNSSFPAFGEMLAFWPLACGAVSGARAVQLVVLAIGVQALGALLPDVPRRNLRWGCVCFVLTPIVLCILPTSHIDVLQAIYEVTAVLALVRYGHTMAPQYLFCGAWLAGCAAACKFLALALLPFAFLAVLLMLHAWQQRDLALPRFRMLVGAAVVMLLPVAPWLARNAVVWGNPLFPFMTGFFPASAAALAPEQLDTLDYFMRQFGPADAGVQLFGAAALARLPLDLFFRARFDTLRFDGVIGPFALVVGALLLMRRLRPAWHDRKAPQLPALLGWYVVFRVLVWLSTSWQMRFIISPYLVVCLAAPLLVAGLRRTALRRAATVALGLSLAMVLPAIVTKMPGLDTRMLGGLTGLHALRLERSPESATCDALSTRAAVFANRPVKVMLVWTQRFALWCPVELYSESYDESASFNTWLAESVDTTVSNLHRLGITHVLVDEPAFFGMPPTGVGAEEGARLERTFAAYRMLRQHGLHELEKRQGVTLWSVD